MNQVAPPSVTVKPAAIAKLLYLVTALLTAVHIAVLIVYYWINDEDKFGFVRLIDMDYEGNLPTLFSAALFLIASFLFWLLSKSDIDASNNRIGWIGLALVFCFLGFDEGTKLHEYVGDFMERFVQAEGFLYFPWVIPYLFVFAVLVVVYLPFFMRLPIDTRRGMIIAAVLFLTGAVGFDIISAGEADANGTDTMLYSALYTVEEVLEMLGLIVLIKTLLTLMATRDLTFSVV